MLVFISHKVLINNMNEEIFIYIKNHAEIKTKMLTY